MAYCISPVIWPSTVGFWQSLPGDLETWRQIYVVKYSLRSRINIIACQQGKKNIVTCWAESYVTGFSAIWWTGLNPW
uniref:Uncharacterized protein n=1 Tax=Arundo donax TaxID=35708 RepID=A0A0A9GCH5_ARUDO